MIEKQTAIILLAGPSASGKTTTAKKADHSFEEIRKKCGTHFLDNFYKPREQLPFWKDGSTNFGKHRRAGHRAFPPFNAATVDAAGSRFSNL